MSITARFASPFLTVAAMAVGGCMTQTHPTQPSVANAPRPSSTTSPSAKVSELLRQALPPETDGREVRVLTVEYPPGGRSAPHRHPGAVFAYVLEGAVLCQVEGQPLRTYQAGEVWYEYPQQLHQVSGNASDSAPAKLLVFFLTQPGKPVLVPQRGADYRVTFS